MDKKMWLSLLMVNLMLILFIGFWKTKKTSEDMGHTEITERLDALEKEGAYNFSLPNLEGKKVSFKSVNADLILLHFWATWCAPCVVEYPSLLKLIEDYDGKIALVAVSSDEEKKDITRFMKRFGQGGENVHHLWDSEQKVAEQFGTQKLPETYIFSDDFRLIRKVPNTEDWDSKRVREFFDFLLDGNVVEM